MKLKLDYKSFETVKDYLKRKSILNNRKLSFSRVHVRALLGLIAFLCLSLAFLPRNSTLQSSKEVTSIAIAEFAIPADLAARVKAKMNSKSADHNLSADLNYLNESTKEADDKESINIAKSSTASAESTLISKNDATAKESNNAKGEEKSNSITELSANKNNSDKIKNDKSKEDVEGKQGATGAVTATTSNEKAKEATKFSFRTVSIRKNDTLAKIFNRYGISSKELKEIMADETAKEHLTSLQPGQTLKLQINSNNKLDELNLDMGPGNSLIVARKESGFDVQHKQTPLEKKIAFGKGEIQASLASSARKAGLDSNIISQMVDIFGSNIDFSQDLQPNDKFRVLFEQKCLDNSPIQTGPILAAEIVYGGGAKSGGKKIQAIRYTDKTGNTAYFSPDGQGLNQAFLRSPVNFTSISSGFGRRRHPVLHKLRQHKGVDFAAPRGTPVQATGDAKVVFVGTKGGYGKVVELQHGPRYSTLYAHLSKFAKDIKTGTAIKKGQVIGYVGRTGLATGDHLHYEFRIDGVHHNPLTVSLPKSKLIPDGNKRQFIAHAKEMIRLMDDHENKISVASIEFNLNE